MTRSEPALPAAARASRLRWFVLAVLYLVCVCDVADRLMLSILAQDIMTELKLSDWEICLLIGRQSLSSMRCWAFNCLGRLLRERDKFPRLERFPCLLNR